MASQFRPKLVVFDLDYTIWPLWVDTHVVPPFTKQRGDVYDRQKNKVELYPDALKILKKLKKEGTMVAAASRTAAIDVAEKLLEAFDLNKYFVAKQIYPGSKVQHFSHFQKTLNIDYKDMIFFDDEMRNIKDLSKIGVTAVHVPDGINRTIFETSLSQFHESKNEEMS